MSLDEKWSRIILLSSKTKVYAKFQIFSDEKCLKRSFSDLTPGRRDSERKVLNKRVVLYTWNWVIKRKTAFKKIKNVCVFDLFCLFLSS